MENGNNVNDGKFPPLIANIPKLTVLSVSSYFRYK